MNYTVEFDVEHFDFWGGAQDRVQDLDREQLLALGEYIEECLGCSDTPPTQTEINDFVWFSCDDWFDQLEEEEKEWKEWENEIENEEDDDDEPEEDEEEDSDE